MIATPSPPVENHAPARFLSAKRILQLISVALAVGAAVAVANLPLYTQVTATSDGVEQVGSATVLDEAGLGYLAVLAIPVVAAVLPLPASGRAWQPLSILSAVLLAGWCILGALSIGWFFVPALAAAVVAVCLPMRRRTSAPVR